MALYIKSFSPHRNPQSNGFPPTRPQAGNSQPPPVVGSTTQADEFRLWVVCDPRSRQLLAHGFARTRPAAVAAAAAAAAHLNRPYYRTGGWLAESHKVRLLFERRSARVERRIERSINGFLATAVPRAVAAAAHAGNGSAVVDGNGASTNSTTDNAGGPRVATPL